VPRKMDLARSLLAPMKRKVLRAAKGQGKLPELASVLVEAHQLAISQPAGTFVIHGRDWPRRTT
jgi:hypothetical protein